MIRTSPSSLVFTKNAIKSSIKRTVKAGAISTIALFGFLSAPAIAGSPASISRSNEVARTALSDFAKTWMGKMERNEAQNRLRPTIRPGATESVITYRGFGEDYKVELRPTGHPSAPYVGILRYTEQVYTCSEVGSSNCSVAASVPVTEIFRYQAGRWIY